MLKQCLSARIDARSSADVTRRTCARCALSDSPLSRESTRGDRCTTTASAEAVASWNRRLFDHCMTSSKCHNAQTPAPRPFTAGQKRGTCSDRVSRRDRRSVLLLSYRNTNNINHSCRHLHPSVPWVGGDSRATPQPLRRQMQARYRWDSRCSEHACGRRAVVHR